MARARRLDAGTRGLFDPARLVVFIDETAANTKMMRVGGRCIARRALLELAGFLTATGKRSPSWGALRCNGMTAPCVIDGAMKGKTFLDYVEQRLALNSEAQRPPSSWITFRHTRQRACAKRLRRVAPPFVISRNIRRI